MIIVEGPDNAGKSTLIKQLLELDPSLRLLHRERFKKGKSENIATSYLKALIPEDGDRFMHANSVADRFLASECIYGALFRGGCRLSDGEHFAIRNLLVSYNALVVHCHPGNDAIMKTWEKRDQMYDSPLPIAKLYLEEIETIFRGLPVIRYNWTSTSANVKREMIVKQHRLMMRNREKHLSWWSALPHGVGQLESPSVILVGEKLSPRASTSVPFAHGPAGDFLAWALDRAQSKMRFAIDREVYVTNAIKGTKQDAAILREELRMLELKKDAVIIALGREAAEMLFYIKPETRCIQMLHPMYMRRFHWNNRDQYVAGLLTAIETTS